MNSFLKQKIKDFISSSITVNEIFLASIIMLIHFSIIIFYYFFPLSSVVSFSNAAMWMCIVLLFFGFPVFFSAKIVFGFSKMTKKLERWFSLWGTGWLIYLIPTTFLLLYSKISDSKTLLINDWVNIIYMGQILLRAILLFLFSHRFKIETFNVRNVSVNKVLVIAVTTFSVYLLPLEHFHIASNPDIFYFQLLPASASAYITGSVILGFHNMFFGKNPRIDNLKV